MARIFRIGAVIGGIAVLAVIALFIFRNRNRSGTQNITATPEVLSGENKNSESDNPLPTLQIVSENTDDWIIYDSQSQDYIIKRPDNINIENVENNTVLFTFTKGGLGTSSGDILNSSKGSLDKMEFDEFVDMQITAQENVPGNVVSRKENTTLAGKKSVRFTVSGSNPSVTRIFNYIETGNSSYLLFVDESPGLGNNLKDLGTKMISTLTVK